MIAAIVIAALALGPIPLADEDLPTLLSRFESSHDRETKETALEWIATKHPEAGPQMLALARDADDHDTRWLAIRGLGRLRYLDGAPFLRGCLDSPDLDIRANAARALGEMHDVAAAPLLVRELEREKDSGGIEQASLALRMIGAREGVPALDRKLAGELGDQPQEARAWIIQAIGDLGSRRDVPVLARYLYRDEAEDAARSIGTITGEDFGIRFCTGPCSQANTPAIRRARAWWQAHRREWSR